MQRLDLFEEKRVIEESGLFDKFYYATLYSDYVKDEPDLVWHYIKEGADLGFDPSPLFDTLHYIKQVAGIRESRLNPLYHYLKFGIAEHISALPEMRERQSNDKDFFSEWCRSEASVKRNPILRLRDEWFLLICGEFDHEYYEKESGISAKNKMKQIRHYLNRGMYDSLAPNSGFDIRFYVNKYALNNLMHVPYIHYLRCGRKNEYWGTDIQEKYERLRNGYAELKREYIAIERIFGNDSLIEGRLLKQTIDSGRRSISVDTGLFLNLIIDEMEILEAKKLLLLIERANYSFVVRILLQSEVLKEKLANYPMGTKLIVCCDWNENDILDDQFIWDISRIPFATIKMVLSYFPYFSDRGVMALLLDKAPKRSGKITSVAALMDKNDYWYVPRRNHCIVRKCVVNVLEREDMQPEEFWSRIDGGKILRLYDPEIEALELLKKPSQIKKSKHIMISIYAFSYGGGEIMPIRLANQLKKMGYCILIHVLKKDEDNTKVRKMLLPNIPVVQTDNVSEMALVLEEFKIDVINSHHQTVQNFLAEVLKEYPKLRMGIRHVATSHGMYNAFSNEELQIIFSNLEGSVDYWTYVADKNIEPFKQMGVYKPELFYKIPNGMEKPVIHPIVRSKLGIEQSAFVFCLASRAIPEKGWEEAIVAIGNVRRKIAEDIQLILIGAGPVYEKLVKHNVPDYIHLLGFRENPCDYYAISDAMILPSYYSSESAPLSIIEALQCGLPVIASDIGDIRQMLTIKGKTAGTVFELNERSVPQEVLEHCIEVLVTDDSYYRECKAMAVERSKDFDIKNIAMQYLRILQRESEKTIEKE